MAELEAQIAQAQADAQTQMKAANRQLIQSALVAEATAARSTSLRTHIVLWTWAR